jgi:hypothetical protein
MKMEIVEEGDKMWDILIIVGRRCQSILLPSIK